eukprot:gene6725-9218_t
MSNTPSETKQDAREARLTIRSLEHRDALKKKLQLEARQKCMEFTNSFGECAKANGLMVVFRCREQSRAMSGCMDQYYDDEKFEAFLIREGYEIPKKKPKSWM